jgi:hypothetical protein
MSAPRHPDLNLWDIELIYGVDYDIDFTIVESDPGDDNVTIRLERVPLTPRRAEFLQNLLNL